MGFAKPGGMIGAGINIAFNIPQYKERRQNGENAAMALGKTALDVAFWEFMGPYAMPLMMAQGAKEGMKAAHQYGYENARISSRAYHANFGGYGRFNDNQVAATMRQRGLQAMQQSQLGGYSNLGNEARSYFK